MQVKLTRLQTTKVFLFRIGRTFDNLTSCPTASKAPNPPRAKTKSKPMTSNKMHNNLLDEGKAIAALASQEVLELMCSDMAVS